MPQPSLKFALLFAATALLAACSWEVATPTPAATAGPAAKVAVVAPTTAAAPTGVPAAATRRPTPASASLAGEPRPAPALVDLVNTDGSEFQLASLAGTPALLFFGYSHCPDVCPATIGELFGVFEARPDVQAVFISVDPERDTVDFLERWTQYFPLNFHAVTGTPGAIRRAADNYGVKYARVETTSTAGYTMSHTADIYLVDQHGRLRWSYPFGTPAEAMIDDIAHLGAG